jgi:hypothetical protein
MGHPDARLEADLARFTTEVQSALGEALLCLAVHGSAAGEDWIAGRSDVNTVVVVPRVTMAVLDALVPVVGRWRQHGFAVPVVMDREYLARARDTFPMELEDIRRQHRLLAGRDLLADVTVEAAALRRECEREARGKLLRLRALFLEAAETPAALERLMLESVKSFLVVLRHLAGLRGGTATPGYEPTLVAGEAVVGPLPTMHLLLAHRAGGTRLAASTLRTDFGAYLAEVERIVAAVDALDG